MRVRHNKKEIKMRNELSIPSIFPKHLNGRGKWNVVKNAFNAFDEAFNEPFFYDLLNLQDIKTIKFPKIDVLETDTHYQVEANVAGLTKDELAVELSDNCLVISGAKTLEHEQKGKYIVNELSYKHFRRVIQLPSPINESQIEASYDNGILRLMIPKILESQKKTTKIEIK